MVKNKKAVITGTTKGIGKAITLKFAEHGFDVAICARTAKEVKAFKDFLNIKFPKINVLAVACDVSDKKQVEYFGDEIINQWGKVDVLVNNAGNFLPGSVYNEKEGTLETLIETNLYSAYRLTRHLINGFIKQKGGHIFNLCSVASIKAYKAGGSYGIMKFALLGFSKNLREELKQHNIKVTSVLPGAVWTQSWAGAGLPKERFIPVEDIAELVWSCYNTSPLTVVEEILVRPVKGDIE
jgi:NADP-dependent 3-hydroxy acid dehydrogenase YdfG